LSFNDLSISFLRQSVFGLFRWLVACLAILPAPAFNFYN